MIYQLIIRDGDSNVTFGLESATVSLLDGPDADERIGVSELALDQLSALGISITCT